MRGKHIAPAKKHIAAIEHDHSVPLKANCIDGDARRDDGARNTSCDDALNVGEGIGKCPRIAARAAAAAPTEYRVRLPFDSPAPAALRRVAAVDQRGVALAATAEGFCTRLHADRSAAAEQRAAPHLARTPTARRMGWVTPSLGSNRRVSSATSPPPSISLIWRRVSYSIAWWTKRTELMFLISALVPRASPGWRTEIFTSQRKLPSSMLPSQVPR